MNRLHSTRVFAAVALLLCAALFSAGCNVRDRSGKEPGERRFVDALGDTIQLSETPQRVVSLAPNVTEILYVLGVDGRIVGVTQFCDYPSEAKKKPQIGGFNIINLEAIVATQPDLVFAQRGNRPEDLAALRRMGIAVFAFRIDSLGALVDALETLGAILGVEDRANAVATSWRQRIDAVDRTVAAIPPGERPVVFFGGTAEPIYSVGPGSFVDDLIRRAGGRNVFADIGSSWPRVDLETLISRNPDVLLLSFQRMGGADKSRDELRTAPGWRALNAVRSGRVYTIGDEALRPGPRIIDALEIMHRAIVEHTAAGQD